MKTKRKAKKPARRARARAAAPPSLRWVVSPFEIRLGLATISGRVVLEIDQ